MIRQGTTEKELMEVLERLDKETATDNIVTNGQPITIKCRREAKGLTNWSIQQDVHNSKFSKPIVYSQGNGYPGILNSIKNDVAMSNINEDIAILCYSCAELKRTYDGKIMTHWIVINPSIPFETEEDGTPRFPMFDLKMTDNEFKVAMESRMALYNECNEDIYPIREVAFSSIGKLLDSAASFKNMAQIPLGSALLLAERFATDLKSLKLIYRNYEGHVKPLIGIAGNRFVQESEVGFYKLAFDTITSMFGSSQCGKWIVTDEYSLATVFISFADENKNDLFADERFKHTVMLKIKTSDVPGVSASVTAVMKHGDAEIYIQKNSAYHWASFIRRGGAESLFYRTERGGNKYSLKDDIERFLSRVETIENNDYVLTEELFHKIVNGAKPIIGKKKLEQNMDKIESLKSKVGTSCNGFAILEEAIDATYFVLPEKQANELSGLYAKIVYMLTEKTAE